MMSSSVPTKRISRIFYIGDLRSGHFCDHPIIPRPDGVWRVTRPDGGWPKGPPLRIFKSKSRRVKIQTALERSRRTLQDKIILTLFLTCDVTGRSKKVKKRSKCTDLQQPTVCHVKQTCLIKWSQTSINIIEATYGWPAEHISKTCDVIRGVNIDQSEDSLVNLTNQRSDCENSNSGQEASHNII